MATYRRSRRGSSFDLGINIPDLNWTNLAVNQYAYFGYADWISQIVQTALFHRSADVDDFFGNISVGVEPISVFSRGLPVLKGTYDYQRDVNKYSNPIGGFFDLITDFDTQKPQNENSAFHTSHSGEYSTKSTQLYTWDLGLKIDFGWGFEALVCDQTYANIFQLRYIPTLADGRFQGPFTPYTYTLHVIGQDFYTVLKRIESLMNGDAGQLSYLEDFVPAYSDAQITYQNRHAVRGYTDLSTYLYACSDFKSSEDSYSYVHYSATSTLLRVCKIRTRFRVVYHPSPRTQSVGGNMIYTVVQHTTINVRWFTALSNYASSEYFGWIELSVSNFDVDFSTETADYFWSLAMLSQPSEDPEEVPDLFREARSRTLSGYDKLFRERLTDFRPSVMFSYADAISKYRALQGDYLEVIYQSEKVLNLLPDVLPLIKVLIDTESDPSEAVRSLAKFFAGLKLQFTFGTQKFVGNVDELTSSLGSVARALENISLPQTVHGTFQYNIGEYMGIEGVEITARSKVRLGGTHIDFVTKLMRLDSLGLSPRSSHDWDLVPFSWLIDMFVNIGGRLDVIDAVIVGLMMDVQYCTHSYTIKYPTPLAVLESNNLDELSPGEFTHYARETSRVIPFLFGTSKIDFGAPKYPPNWGIIAALGYSFLGS